MLPTSLQPAIEFYDAGKLCAAASVQDNLLFGRIASDQAGAEAAIHAVIRRVLTDRGLDAEVSRIGLEQPDRPAGAAISPSSEIAADRSGACLVRQPECARGGARPRWTARARRPDALVARLRRSLIGRGLMLVTSGNHARHGRTRLSTPCSVRARRPAARQAQTRQPELMAA